MNDQHDAYTRTLAGRLEQLNQELATLGRAILAALPRPVRRLLGIE